MLTKGFWFPTSAHPRNTRDPPCTSGYQDAPAWSSGIPRRLPALFSHTGSTAMTSSDSAAGRWLDYNFPPPTPSNLIRNPVSSKMVFLSLYRFSSPGLCHGQWILQAPEHPSTSIIVTWASFAHAPRLELPEKDTSFFLPLSSVKVPMPQDPPTSSLPGPSQTAC